MRSDNFKFRFKKGGIDMLDILFFVGILFFYVIFNYFAKWCEEQVGRANN